MLIQIISSEGKKIIIEDLPIYHTDNVKVNLASHNLVKLSRNQEGVDVIATLLLTRLEDNK